MSWPLIPTAPRGDPVGMALAAAGLAVATVAVALGPRARRRERDAPAPLLPLGAHAAGLQGRYVRVVPGRLASVVQIRDTARTSARAWSSTPAATSSPTRTSSARRTRFVVTLAAGDSHPATARRPDTATTSR